MKMTETQKEEIISLRKSGVGYGKIAQTLGVPINTVKSFCRRNVAAEVTVTKPSMIFSGEITTCENCGREIRQVAKQKKKRFCSDKCRNNWWNAHLTQVNRKAVYKIICPNCGKEFQIYGDKRRKYCSHKCYIAYRFKVGVRND